MQTPSHNRLTRRSVLALIAGSIAAAASLPGKALALTTAEAQSLVGRMVTDIQKAIGSGRSGAAVYRDFQRIFEQYGDVPIIAQSVLGVEWRSATNAQRRAFSDAFSGYLARKYGRRFEEFRGAEIVVNSARPVRSFFEVRSTARLRGESPIEVIFLVSNRSGQDKFFNIIIEGVNLHITERTEIGALLDQRGGDLDRLIADLKTLG